MHEACARSVLRAGQHVHQSVENMVADKGAGRLGCVRRDASRAHRVHHTFNRQGRKVRGRSTLKHGHVHRLLACVVGYRSVVEVDGNTLKRQAGAATRHTQRNHQNERPLRQCLLQHLRRTAKHAGQLAGHHLRTGHRGAVQRAGDLPRGVDHVAAKWLEAGKQDFLHDPS